ncbi:hypothetical protein ACA910_019739 [Epithemia clementina (nom. ined.)]
MNGSTTSMFLIPSVFEHGHSVPNTNTQSEGASVVPDYQSEPYQQHRNIARNSCGTMKHNSAEDTQPVIPHNIVEHVDITSSDLHLDPSEEETHSTLSQDTNTFIDPPEEHALNSTFFCLSADNGEPFKACVTKIIDDSDQVTKKAPVDIDNPDEDAMQTKVDAKCQELAFSPIGVQVPNASHCSLVDKSWNPYCHGENAPTVLFTTKSALPKDHSTANTVMTNQPLLSPLCGKHYNMAQQQLHHVATLRNKVMYDNRPLATSSICSDAHLGQTSSAPSYDVFAHCNQDSLPDFPTYHTKAQISIRSEYFDAFSQLTHLIAQKKLLQVTCPHGETKHDRHSICMETLHEKNAPNTAFENSTPNHLMHHSPSLHPPDLCAPFRIFVIS